jgi:uncharacterized tellurite resistance protein B-like protein
MADASHPLTAFPESERVDYLFVVASLARADGVVTDSEILHLTQFCRVVGISGANMGRVIGATEDADAQQIRATISRLRESPLRFHLLSDLFYLAFADGVFSPSEQSEISAIADALGVTPVQLAAIRNTFEAARKANESRGVSSTDWKALGGEVAAALASAGVPVAAVAASGTVVGLSGAGITSGLAALGMGFGMATGVGTAAAIGVGSYFAVRWLYRRVVGA